MVKKIGLLVITFAMIFSNFNTVPISANEGNSDEVNDTVPLKTWYTEPATSWESEALPLGNGHLGAMIFGGIEKDQILVNEKTLWSGGPGANPDYNGGHKDTAEEKHAILQDVRLKLQDLMTEHSKGTAPYIDDNGNVIARNYAVPSSIQSIINGNQRTGDKGLIGTKDNFGSYQELGSIWLQDPGSTRPEVTRYFTEQDHRSNPNEGVGMLFDGDINTKYFADGHANATEYIIEWEFSKPFSSQIYAITTGNDEQKRDPKEWTLLASEDGDEFTVIDTVTDFLQPGRKVTVPFEMEKPGTYKYFKLHVTKLHTDDQALQMSELKIIYDEDAESNNQVISDYKRELDLDNSMVNVSYMQGNVEFKREYFISNPDNVMGIRLSASEPGALNQFISVTSAQQRKTITSEDDTITMIGWPNDHNKPNAETDFDNTLHFAQQIKVMPSGGTLVAQHNGIMVEDADEIIILMSAGTNYQQAMDDSFHYFTGIDPLVAVNERIETAAQIGIDALYDTHVADYKNLFERVKLNLMNVSFPNKPTDRLLKGYAKSNTPSEDRYLEQLYYQFGRYLLISSSREGSLPANLQGIWANGTNPPWSSDYHVNINLQMNYWLAEQTNLSETNVPLLEFIKSLVPRGEISAQHGYAKPDGEPVRGWTAHHEINVWGNTGPATSDAFFSPEDGAWLAQHIWERYQYTMDEDFLRENYDILLGAALFWVDTLWEDTRDNTLVANPSYSPEHGPYSLGATEVQSVVWGIFEEVIKASQVLGYDTPEVEEIKLAQSRLAGPKIGLGGQFMEWKDETAMDISGDNGHRHVNHLYALHPGSQIVAGRSAEDNAFVDAMKVTLNTRGDGGTGWSKAWKINFWARLHDGDRAQKLLKELLVESTLSNLFDTHPPFQIDGNFGATAGMTEMLLQSQGGSINLLPALPSKWSTGSITGLKARGNVEVDMAWEQSHLESATLKTGTTGPITVKGKNISTATVQQAGNHVAFETVDRDTIIIQAQQGASYILSNIEEVSVSHNPFTVIHAIDADVTTGNIFKGAVALEDASANDYAVYKNVEFGTDGAQKVVIEAASNKKTAVELGRIELRLNSPNGEVIANILADHTGDLKTFKKLTANLTSTISGTHDLFVTFTQPIHLKSVQFFTHPTYESAETIKVLGYGLISLPASDSTNATYVASVALADGTTETASSNVTWHLSGNYSGVKLSQEGVLSIKEGVGTQEIMITAASKQNPEIRGQLQVRLVTGNIVPFELRPIHRNDESAGSNPSGKMQFGNEWLEFVSANGWIKFNNVNLKDGLEHVIVGYASPNAGTRQIQIRIAEPGIGTVTSATTVASLNTSASTGGWQTLEEVSTSNVAEATGIKDVYIFWPQGDFNLRHVKFDLLEANEGTSEYYEAKFSSNVEGITLVVKDSEGYLYSSSSEDAMTFKLPMGEYTYTASKQGLITKTEQFKVTEEGVSISIELVADHEPPTWPSTKKLTASNIGEQKLTLTWSAAEDNIGVTDYRIYKGTELIGTVAGSELSYEVTGLTKATRYTFSIEAGDAAGNWSTDGPTVTLTTTGNTGGGNGSNQNPITTVDKDNNEPNKIVTAKPIVDAGGTATATIGKDAFSAAKNASKQIFVTIPSVENAKSYALTLPIEALAAEDHTRTIEVTTPIGTITASSAMITALEAAGAESATLFITKMDNSHLDATLRDRIGDRPMIELGLKIDGMTIDWSNQEAPVVVSIPYTPSTTELLDPEHIVVWFMNSSGEVVPVPSGRYDATTGMVTFTATHFSSYAVAYVKKTFEDISNVTWAKKEIEVMAAKGIINGTSSTTYSPNAAIKRADFIVLMVGALGLHANTDTNFSDVNQAAYYAHAVAVAKKLGIAEGSGDNKFYPEAYITRQDMMVLIDRALKAAQTELATGTDSDLNAYVDKSSVASYAEQSVSTLIKNRIIVGNNHQINPLGQATRAETAVLMYRLYHR